MAYAMNVSSVDHCKPCDDTGYVELAGITKAHGIATSRGTAPCKWCEQGRRRYGRLVELRQHPDSNFSLEDVIGYGDDHRPATPAELASIAQERPALKPLPSTRESERMIEARKHAAAKAAREASRPEPTQVAPPPPRGAEPAGTLTHTEPEELPF